MATFQKADGSVKEMADALLAQFPSHEGTLNCEVTVDYVFAYGARDEDGKKTGDALSKNGVRALGICRVMPLKDRAMGRADVEISVDADWWQDASLSEQKAVLDHELHHIKVTGKTDDLGRPKIRLRKHDYEFGWFRIVADRHGHFSQERIQARSMMERDGQYFWPDLTSAKEFAKMEAKEEGGSVTISAPGHEPMTFTHEEFKALPKKIAKLREGHD